MNAKIILENINKIMKPIICIISFFALGLIPSYAENKSDSLISEMREVELFIEKPTDKLPHDVEYSFGVATEEFGDKYRFLSNGLFYISLY